MIRLTRKHVIRVIVALLILGAVIGAISGTLYYLSWKDVTFNLSANTKSLIVYSKNDDEDYSSDTYKITSIDTSSTVRLRTGSYVAVPTGDTISNAAIAFSINGDTTVDINPYYSDEYLSKAFSGELNSINTAITTKYPIIASNYTLGDGKFYHFGDWYATILYNSNPDPGDGVDVYGIILHKVGDSWEVSAPPSIVFTYANSPSLPRDIIDLSNGLVNDY